MNTTGKGKIVKETDAPIFDPYRLYIERASQNDRIFVKECNESMDTMMVFAGLFSAAITQFIASTYSLLQPDAQGRSNDLLVTLIALTKDPSTTDISGITSLPDFQPSMQAVAINSLFFFSLILSILSGLGAMLVKQMARRYETHCANQTLPWKKARIREKRREAFLRWRVDGVIAFIPMILHIALVLFLVGILIWTSILSNGCMIPSTILVSLAGALYFLLALAPSVSEDTPFQWPASTGVKSLVHASLCLKEKIRHWSVDHFSFSRSSTWQNTSPFEPMVTAFLATHKTKLVVSDVEKGAETMDPQGIQSDMHQTEGPHSASPANALRTTPRESQLPDLSARSPPDIAFSDKGPEQPAGLSATARQITSLPQIDSSTIPFIVTPSSVDQSQREQIYPPSYDILDLVVLINVIRETEVFQELEVIFEVLRTADWGGTRIGDTLSAQGEVVLQRCASVTATTWYILGDGPALKDHFRERARKMALFVEWFYYQLTPNQRHALTSWPHPGFAEGLVLDIWKDVERYSLPKVPLDDVLLGSSVLAKLHHVQLAEGEVCNRCIISKDRIIEERNAYDIRNRLALPDWYLPGGKWTTAKPLLDYPCKQRFPRGLHRILTAFCTMSEIYPPKT